jgi:xanthine/CO dehydrogenase XdhC/CoxF family maturation factor
LALCCGGQTTLVDERTQAVLQALAKLDDAKLRAKIYALRVKDEGAFGRAVANQQLEGELQGTLDTLTVLATSMFP